MERKTTPRTPDANRTKEEALRLVNVFPLSCLEKQSDILGQILRAFSLFECLQFIEHSAHSSLLNSHKDSTYWLLELHSAEGNTNPSRRDSHPSSGPECHRNLGLLEVNPALPTHLVILTPCGLGS